MIADTANRLFAGFGPAGGTRNDTGEMQAGLWNAVEEAGFPLALLSEEDGGFGLTPAEALGIVRIAAFHAVSAPLAETMFANWLLAASRQPLCEGMAAVVIGGVESFEKDKAWTAPRIAWGRDAATLVILSDDGHLARLDKAWTATQGGNIAGEPRDDLRISVEIAPENIVPSPLTIEAAKAATAGLRAIALAGAMEAALEQTVRYANERVQFGKPIGKFQAVQQNLATMASQVAAARAAADLVARSFPDAMSDGPRFIVDAAAAKTRASEAAGIAASIAHAVHGAIGFTQESSLQLLTRRLWSWRDEYGSEHHWADVLGARVASLAPDGYWPFITGKDGVAA
jgi:alkylation response protein AidB-like acyl-CoA dehydrogenase